MNSISYSNANHAMKIVWFLPELESTFIYLVLFFFLNPVFVYRENFSSGIYFYWCISLDWFFLFSFITSPWQEDKEPVFDSVKAIVGMLEVSAEFAQNITFNLERIQKALPAGYLDATTLADYLVKKVNNLFLNFKERGKREENK